MLQITPLITPCWRSWSWNGFGKSKWFQSIVSLWIFIFF